MEENEISMAGLTPEEKDEFVVEQSMKIILNSGDARNYAANAMNCIIAGEFDKAKEFLKEAAKVQTVAHAVQTAMLQGDIRGGEEKMGYYVLFAHAQDTLMTIQVEINMTKKMLKLAQSYEARIAALEERIGK